MSLSRVVAACVAAFTLSSSAFAVAPYDSTGATVELVPVAGGAAVASTTVTFPPDAVTVNLSIPSSIIAGLAPGASVSYFARATSNALTAGSTCNANVLSRQITFTKAGNTSAVGVPTLGGLALVLLALVVGAVAHRQGRASRVFGALLPLMAVAVLMLTGTRELNAQSSDPNTTYAGSADDAVQSVRALVDGAGVVTVTVGRATGCGASMISLVSENLPNFELTSSLLKVGSLTVSRAVPTSSTISARFVDAVTNQPMIGGTVSITASGTTTLQVNYTTPISFGGRTVRLEITIDGVVLQTSAYTML